MSTNLFGEGDTDVQCRAGFPSSHCSLLPLVRPGITRVLLLNEVASLRADIEMETAVLKEFPRCPQAKSVGRVSFHGDLHIRPKPGDPSKEEYQIVPGYWQDAPVTVH